MRIKSLVLVGYKRLLLKNVTYFKYTPTADCQLILGTNGSGKSSVMRELSPLPANPTDYLPDGYKEIIIEDGGCVYICTSTFGRKAEHSFYKDTVNLNPGGTITVQRDLVKRWFGLDDELFKLLIGATSFTSMPALKRRDWIMRLSGNDLSYAMRVFGKLKTQLRDAQGVAKHMTKRLGEESDKLPNPDEVDRLRVICEETKDELTLLMENKDANVGDKRSIQTNITRLTAELESVSKAICKAHVPVDRYTDIESVDNEILAVKLHTSGLQQRLDVYHTEYAKYEDIITALSRVDTHGLEELDLKIGLKRRELSRLASQLTRPLADYGTESDTYGVEALIPALVDVLSEMPANREQRFNVNERNIVNDALTNARRQFDEHAVTIGKLRHAMEHARTGTQHNCPKCGFGFIAGDRQTPIAELETKLQTLSLAQQQSNDCIAMHVQFLDEYGVYQTYARQLTQLSTTYAYLTVFWDSFRSKWNQGISPKTYVSEALQWATQAAIARQYLTLSKELTEHEAAYNALQANNELGVASIHARVAEIQHELYCTGEAIEANRVQIKELEVIKRCFVNLQQNTDKLTTCYKQLSMQIDEFVKAVRNETFSDLIRERQSLLANTENVFYKAVRAQALIDDLKQSKAEAALDAEAWAILIQELSPSEGLIADQVNIFMQCFIDNINSIIEAIWTYDLKVLACGLDGAELDYKFPMSVALGAQDVDDISEGSTAQVAGVNFAFKLVTMLFLGLEHYPLYLDELAPSLDEQHRINITVFVKQFLEMRKCDSLFMISHYLALHGSFSNVEVCVMDASNIITLPAQYNQHVVIK